MKGFVTLLLVIASISVSAWQPMRRPRCQARRFTIAGARPVMQPGLDIRARNRCN